MLVCVRACVCVCMCVCACVCACVCVHASNLHTTLSVTFHVGKKLTRLFASLSHSQYSKLKKMAQSN